MLVGLATAVAWRAVAPGAEVAPPSRDGDAGIGLAGFVADGVRVDAGGPSRGVLRAWRARFAYRDVAGARVGPPVGLELKNVQAAWGPPGPGSVELIAERSVLDQRPGVRFEGCVLRLDGDRLVNADTVVWVDPDRLFVRGRGATPSTAIPLSSR